MVRPTGEDYDKWKIQCHPKIICSIGRIPNQAASAHMRKKPHCLNVYVDMLGTSILSIVQRLLLEILGHQAASAHMRKKPHCLNVYVDTLGTSILSIVQRLLLEIVRQQAEGKQFVHCREVQSVHYRRFHCIPNLV